MLETDATKSLVIISFRGSSKDKELMNTLARKLNCKPSAVVRIGLRILNEVVICSVLSEAMHRVHVYDVLQKEQDLKNVLRGLENVLREEDKL